MARDQEDVFCPQDTWTELTNADVTNLTLQSVSGVAKVRVTADATAPANTVTTGLLFKPPYALVREDITKIAAGGGARVWGRAFSAEGAIFFVDHA